MQVSAADRLHCQVQLSERSSATSLNSTNIKIHKIQKHRNTKTQKHKNTKNTKKYRSTKTQKDTTVQKYKNTTRKEYILWEVISHFILNSTNIKHTKMQNHKRTILPERVHHWRNILSCTAKTSKHLIKKNIAQFICILWPSFDQTNIFDNLNIKTRQWWNAEFHHFCTLIRWYLKNIFSLSKIFCSAKLG